MGRFPAKQELGMRTQGRETVGSSRLWSALVVALLLRLLLVGTIHLYHGQFLFLDDRGYDAVATKLADAWRRGTFPDPSSVSLAGTSTYGYFLLLGGLYYLFDSSWLVVKLFGAVASGLVVLPAASIGKRFGGHRLEMSAAWLVAVYPIAVFWGATGLKDGPLATLFLCVIAIGLKPFTPRRFAVQLGLCGILFLLRPGLGLAGLLTLVVPFAQAIRARGDLFRSFGRRTVALASVTVLVYLALPHVARFLQFVERAASSESVAGLPSGSVLAGSGPTISSLVTALVGPFPWAFGEGTDTVYRALYPGMVLWIALLPAGGLGAWEIVRRGTAAARGAVASGLVYFFMYIAYFGNEGFYRQRFVLEAFFLVLSAFAFHVRADSAILWTAVWVVCLGPAILVHTAILPLWGVAMVFAGTLSVYALMRRLRTRSLHAG